MPIKLDTEAPLFLGTVAVRESTTFGVIRKAVHELNDFGKGNGVSYAALEAHLLANFKPAKSESYGPSYIKAYVRDAVNKYDYLSHKDVGADYTSLEPTPKKEAKPKAEKAVSKGRQSQLELLTFIRDRGEVASVADITETKITISTIVEETKKKTKSVEKMVATLATEGLVTSEAVEKEIYVFLTEAGLDLIGLPAQADADAESELA